MEPFNIRINYGSNEVTLTILPSDNSVFKIVYYGGILGGIRKNADEWEPVGRDEIGGEDLPLYQPKHGDERINVELTEQVVDRIGDEIDFHLEEL